MSKQLSTIMIFDPSNHQAVSANQKGAAWSLTAAKLHKQHPSKPQANTNVHTVHGAR
eukprot:m.71341 g.71341  ORF g.71341 m.71341 type:complete len:57 (-) comp12294_c2_seq1:4094-4264(-)